MTWACPCNGCKKAQKVVIDQIIKEYKSCPNIVELEKNLFCYTWWRHDDCLRLMNLLNSITKDDKYSIPPVRREVKDAIAEIINDPDTVEILRRLEDNGI
jgi:hypothetical protein